MGMLDKEEGCWHIQQKRGFCTTIVVCMLRVGRAELKIPSSKQKNEQKARIEPVKSISDDCWSWLAMVF